MNCIFLIAAAIASAPAPAQAEPAAAPAAAPAAEPVDPSRLAAARTTVDHIWPLGTYERMMRGTMTEITDNMTSSMFDLQLGDLGPGPDGKPLDSAEARTTLREAAMKADPHFEERMKITNRVIMEEMAPLMARMEPKVRDSLARAYARKFTVEQLAEMNRFFATPAGGAYARDSMTVWMDPEIVTAMSGFSPDLVKEMPQIMAKVEAATAHLPAPPAERRRRKKR